MLFVFVSNRFSEADDADDGLVVSITTKVVAICVTGDEVVVTGKVVFAAFDVKV